MRILHVLQPANDRPAPVWAGWPTRDPAAAPGPWGGSDAAMLAVAGVAKALPEHEHEVLLLGGAAAQRRAREAGIVRAFRAAPPLGLPRLAGPTVRGLLRAVPWFDVIQFWGASMGPLAARLPRQRSLVLDLTNGMVSPVRGGRVRGPMATAPAGVIDPGLPPFLSHAAPVSPSSSIQALSARAEPAERDRVRRELGLATDELALLFIADPPTTVAAHAGAVLGSIMHNLEFRVACVLPGGEAGAPSDLDRAMRLVREAGTTRRIVFTDRPAWRVAGGCDVGVLSEPWPRLAPTRRDMATRLVAAACVRAGLPIVGAADGSAFELIDACPDASARLARPAELAKPVWRLLESEPLRRALHESQLRIVVNAPNLADLLGRAWANARATFAPVGSA